LGGSHQTDSLGYNVGFLLFDSALTIGRYDLTESPTYRLDGTIWTRVIPSVFCDYGFEQTIDGYVEFTNVDRPAHIVSGRFEFFAVAQCDTLNVTEGRFDLIYAG